MPVPAARPTQEPPIRGLFRRHVAGDDALLELAALRFAQAGMPAELYAESLADLEHVLPFVPPHPALPTVHLPRSLDLLEHADRDAVARFVTAFSGRIAGVVVHDRPQMRHHLLEVVTALRVLGGRDEGPYVWLEYASGAPLDWFAEIAARIATLGRAGLCIDIGHVGLAQVQRDLARPPTVVGHLTMRDGALQGVAERVQQATAAALPAVLGLIDDVGATGTAVHFHLHDGHPAIPDLSDHVSFLYRLPVPFRHAGKYSLDPMYGPVGLAAVLARAVDAVRADRLTLTLEVHQAEGRLPLAGGARALFRQWADLTNAERFNFWLGVVADNHLLATTAIRSVPGIAGEAAPAADGGDPAGPAPPPAAPGLPLTDATRTVGA